MSMATSSRRRLGIASIAAGALYFAGQAGELVFGSPSDVVDVVFVVLGVGGSPRSASPSGNFAAR